MLSDAELDALFPVGQRFRSTRHWTPVDVAVRAVALLAPTADESVLDVGAGVGKLCLVGALAGPGTWFGIERDAAMVRAATAAARRLGLGARARFVCGDASDMDWSRFAAFYLYNPFVEDLWLEAADPEARRTTWGENLALVEQSLALAKPGTRVVTYHGFGGNMPAGWTCVLREPARADELCLWVR